jgi:Bifunctional DNA primase/polymerase, N-terminal
VATVLEVRQALVDRGFTPIPVIGKAPPFKSWQNINNVSRSMLEAWARNWPRATNTGILTRVTPTIDIDVLNEPAAIAAENLARERFEERGFFLVRIGKPPKRAIPFRTLQPFGKLTTNFNVPAGADAEKIEFLCDGQQFVAHGIHPGTRRPYGWFGGDPTTIGYDDLPYISAEEAEQLQRDIAELLIRDFGYVVALGRPARKGNGAVAGAPEDWKILIDRIRNGQDLHASIRDLVAKAIRSGMQGGAAVNLLRGVMESSDSSVVPRDDRWQDRYDDIPRAVASMEAKIERQQAAAAAAIAPTPAPAGGTPPPPPPPPSSPSVGPTPSAAPGPIPHSPIEATLKIFREWLLLDNDAPVLAMLGVVAANMLPGDAIWLGIIAPPSSAKTEMLITLANIPHTEMVGTLSVAGLLSGTPRRQQAAGAKGGLLQKIGTFGFLVLKDFGSILSMRPESKAELLAALREIYDGKWTRIIGADGGKTLQWSGKIGLLFGCTRVYDSYYSVISELGDRFLLCRMEPNEKQFLHAIKHANRAAQMRARLVEAVTNLFAGPLPAPRDITDREIKWLNGILLIAVRLRGAVKRDYRTRELEDIYGAEGTARFGKALERVLSGLDCLGVRRSKARKVIKTIAFDSVPPNRLSVYRYMKKKLRGRLVDTTTVAKTVKLPTSTAHRVLEELVIYGLAERNPQGPGRADLWRAV